MPCFADSPVNSVPIRIMLSSGVERNGGTVAACDTMGAHWIGLKRHGKPRKHKD